MTTVRVAANYYEQFDADPSLKAPAEGYAGWKKTELELDLEHTALVSMHAWHCGTWDEYPGWFRKVEYIPRSYAICETVFPRLLAAVRSSPAKLFHVVQPNSAYYREYPGYKRAAALAGEATSAPERLELDETTRRLLEFKQQLEAHNADDIARGQAALDFPEQARPMSNEGIAESSEQLFALCKEEGVRHLIYIGFAINGCLMLSPGGMFDMSRRGLVCSAVRQAVTAIENKETAREEAAKEIALWQVAILFGFVYDAEDLAAALERGSAC